MRTTLLSSLITLAILFTAGITSADVTAQFAAGGFRGPDDPNVSAFRFTVINGKNTKMGGFDLGFASLSESQDLSGFALIFGLHRLTGNMNGGAVFSLVNIHDGDDKGLNAGFVNKVNDATGAMNLGLVNIADGRTLIDTGALNMAQESTAQLGMINITTKLRGFQLGFINIAENGFLPVFPIFNFPKR
ncbi:MAG: phaC PHA synthase [Myxococcota bacterium]